MKIVEQKRTFIWYVSETKVAVCFFLVEFIMKKIVEEVVKEFNELRLDTQAAHALREAGRNRTFD